MKLTSNRIHANHEACKFEVRLVRITIATDTVILVEVTLIIMALRNSEGMTLEVKNQRGRCANKN